MLDVQMSQKCCVGFSEVRLGVKCVTSQKCVFYVSGFSLGFCRFLCGRLVDPRSNGQDKTGQPTTTQHNTAQHSTAQRSEASTAQQSTALHLTGQHSKAQHCTALHSTADKAFFGWRNQVKENYRRAHRLLRDLLF